jgi:hypothetical protein
MNMNEQRVIELIDSYGAIADNWPDDQRSQALSLLAGSESLQRHFREAERADIQLHAMLKEQAVDEAGHSRLRARILEQLPDKSSRRLRLPGWLNIANLSTARLSAMALASVMFLVVGLVLVQQAVENNPDEFDRWAWEQVTGNGDDTAAQDRQPTILAVLAPDALPDDEL